MPAAATGPAGIGLKRNPGVTCLWTTRTYTIFRAGTDGGARDGILFNLGEPDTVEWFAEGREATRAEVEESVMSGLPLLEEMAQEQGADAVTALYAALEEARDHWPT